MSSQKNFGINSYAAILTMLLWVIVGFSSPAVGRKRPPLTSLTVIVTDYSTHKPVFQARLTLEFVDPKSRLGHVISYSTKTDLQGKYKFEFIPMEKVYLIVTSPDHQTLGKTFQVTENNPLIRLALRKPQPLR